MGLSQGPLLPFRNNVCAAVPMCHARDVDDFSQRDSSNVACKGLFWSDPEWFLSVEKDSAHLVCLISGHG